MLSSCLEISSFRTDEPLTTESSRADSSPVLKTNRIDEPLTIASARADNFLVLRAHRIDEPLITEDYEIIDRVYFNKNKAFDTGYYGNNTTFIDVMFQRTSISAAAYLFGLTQGNRLTGYLSSGSAYWRYGNAYPTFATATLKIYKGVVTPGKTTVDDTSKTFTVNEFTTMDPIPVGGYKSGTNPITKHYIGYIYYFRMWHGDTLLVDWYPCKRLSDGVEGFWDCVTQTFIEPL